MRLNRPGNPKQWSPCKWVIKILEQWLSLRIHFPRLIHSAHNYLIIANKVGEWAVYCKSQISFFQLSMATHWAENLPRDGHQELRCLLSSDFRFGFQKYAGLLSVSWNCLEFILLSDGNNAASSKTVTRGRPPRKPQSPAFSWRPHAPTACQHCPSLNTSHKKNQDSMPYRLGKEYSLMTIYKDNTGLGIGSYPSEKTPNEQPKQSMGSTHYRVDCTSSWHTDIPCNAWDQRHMCINTVWWMKGIHQP